MASSQRNATKGITGLAKFQLPTTGQHKIYAMNKHSQEQGFFVHQTYLVESLDYC